MIRGPLHCKNTAALPANSGYSQVFDSTKYCDQPLTIAAARTAPGRSRGMLAGKRVAGFVKPTAQAVTLNFLILTDTDGTTNAAWEIDVNAPFNGTVAVASGTAQPFSWLPRGDFMIEVLAGGTAPTAIDSDLNLTDDTGSGAV